MDRCVLTIVADDNGKHFRIHEPVKAFMLHHDFKYEIWYDSETKSWAARIVAEVE